MVRINHGVRLSSLALLAAPMFFGQIPSTRVDVSSGSHTSIAEPAVPADPLELVTADAQPVQTAEQRASVRNLLFNAFRLSNVRAYPYDRKTVFTAFGSSASDGSWQLEDMSPGEARYRWTAQGPSYSGVNLTLDQVLYSSQAAGTIPLRLAQVRTAIFHMRPIVGPYATLRTANANLNGAALTCVLLSHMGIAKGAIGGRSWNEAEYCIDSASGALVIYSALPGLYTLYDYSQAFHFHDRLIPSKFTITEAGRTVIEAQTVGVSEPPKDASLFQPAGLTQIGVGPEIAAPWEFRSTAASGLAPAHSAQMVTVHGLRSAAGAISDLEVLASSDTALNQPALEMAAKWTGSAIANDAEPGATPQSHEMLITFMFVGGQR